MSGETDNNESPRAEAEAMSSAYSGGAAGHGAPPYGWYYFGPEPAWSQPGANAWRGASHGIGHGDAGPSSGHHGPSGGAAPPYGQTRVDNSDLTEAFDRLSRGDLSADTIGKLLNLDDRDFWTGALLGAAAALLATNLPNLMSILSGAARPKPGADDEIDRNDTKRKSDAYVNKMNEERK
ncbi:MAG: hypothetical protein ACXW3T_01505 [Rhodoplanes sp.]